MDVRWADSNVAILTVPREVELLGYEKLRYRDTGGEDGAKVSKPKSNSHH